MGSAFFDAAKNLVTKRSLQKDKVHPLVVAWAWSFYALPITGTIALFHLPSQLSPLFWQVALTSVFFDFVALWLFTKAIEKTDLSLALPMLAFVPLVLLCSGAILSNEVPTPLGLFGVLLIVSGAYLLHLTPKHHRPLDPLRAIVHHRGSLLMLATAVIWGWTAPLHKTAILESNPYFYTGFSGFLIALGYTPLAYLANRRNMLRTFTKKKVLHLAPIGLLDGIAVLLQFMAQQTAYSVFVLAVKRSSIMLTAVGGAVFFGESIRRRLVPIVVMLSGVAAIAISTW